MFLKRAHVFYNVFLAYVTERENVGFYTRKPNQLKIAWDFRELVVPLLGTS